MPVEEAAVATHSSSWVGCLCKASVTSPEFSFAVPGRLCQQLASFRVAGNALPLSQDALEGSSPPLLLQICEREIRQEEKHWCRVLSIFLSHYHITLDKCFR